MAKVRVADRAATEGSGMARSPPINATAPTKAKRLRTRFTEPPRSPVPCLLREAMHRTGCRKGQSTQNRLPPFHALPAAANGFAGPRVGPGHSLRAASGPVMRSSSGNVEAMIPRAAMMPAATIR